MKAVLDLSVLLRDTVYPERFVSMMTRVKMTVENSTSAMKAQLIRQHVALDSLITMTKMLKSVSAVTMQIS